MNETQRQALQALQSRYGGPTINEDAFYTPFDLPAGWVAGWIKGPSPIDPNVRTNGVLYVGCDPEGNISS